MPTVYYMGMFINAQTLAVHFVEFGVSVVVSLTSLHWRKWSKNELKLVKYISHFGIWNTQNHLIKCHLSDSVSQIFTQIVRRSFRVPTGLSPCSAFRWKKENDNYKLHDRVIDASGDSSGAYMSVLDSVIYSLASIGNIRGELNYIVAMSEVLNVTKRLWINPLNLVFPILP